MAERLTISSKRAMVDRRNALNDTAVELTRRMMSGVGIDVAASERREVPLAGEGCLLYSNGKLVSRVIRTQPIPDAVADDGSGVRIVEKREEYHVKRPLIPAFVGGLAYSRTAFSKFTTEAVFATDGDGESAAAVETPPRLGFEIHTGHVGVIAQTADIERSVASTVSFMGHMRDVMVASRMIWAPTLMQPVQELAGGIPFI